LIDSRTGHTDVGGICTRQLPDAVVAMFFPNEQNISGLSEVCRGVRKENADRRKASHKEIVLNFVVCNVPMLDDEVGILQERISNARTALGYQKEGVIIHHYDSLELMNQSIFTRVHPKSRLAKEYVNLVGSIVSDNLQDRQAALAFLRSFARTLAEGANISGAGEVIQTQLTRVDEILDFHRADGEVLFEVSKVRQHLGDTPTVLSLLTSAIDHGYVTANVLGRRSLAFMNLQRGPEAIEDLKRILDLDSAHFNDVYQAANHLADLQRTALLGLGSRHAFMKLDALSRCIIAEETLLVDRELLPEAIKIASEIREGVLEPRISYKSRNVLILGLIAIGDFRRAMTLVAQERKIVETSENIEDVFNYAMAEWGHSGSPSRDLLLRVRSLDQGRRPGVNYNQCLALVNALLGDHDKANERLDLAARSLDLSPKSDFSVWRYLRVSPQDIRKDLASMRRAFKEPTFRPPFMGTQQLLLA
jgi:tetratricopeptide (TPR) repeat protein